MPNLTQTALSSLLTQDQAAKILGIQPQTLQVWRTTGRYDLPFVKIGRNVRYHPDELKAYIDRQTVKRVEV